MTDEMPTLLNCGLCGSKTPKERGHTLPECVESLRAERDKTRVRALRAEEETARLQPEGRVCAGSGWPCVIPATATGVPATYECGICHQPVRYSPDGRAVTHAAQPEGEVGVPSARKPEPEKEEG